MGAKVRMSNKNMYYTQPPPHGRKIGRTECRIDTTRAREIAETQMICGFKDSRWVSIKFLVGECFEVWTNVVREPLQQRAVCSSCSHWTDYHNQWGRRQ